MTLLKSPEKHRRSVRSYRGICLLPVLGKVLERIMIERLQERATVQASRRQFGFKPGRSANDAWLHVRNRVDNSSAKYILGVVRSTTYAGAVSL